MVALCQFQFTTFQISSLWVVLPLFSSLHWHWGFLLQRNDVVGWELSNSISSHVPSSACRFHDPLPFPSPSWRPFFHFSPQQVTSPISPHHYIACWVCASYQDGPSHFPTCTAGAAAVAVREEVGQLGKEMGMSAGWVREDEVWNREKREKSWDEL